MKPKTKPEQRMPVEIAIPDGYVKLPGTATLRKGDLIATAFWRQTRRIGTRVDTLHWNTYIRPIPELKRKRKTNRIVIPKGFRELETDETPEATDLVACRPFSSNWVADTIREKRPVAWLYIRPI